MRNGNKISRFFRTNLALMFFLGSFVPVQTEQIQPETIIQYPIQIGYVSQGYSIFHPALDIAAPKGTEIKPIKDGVVEDVSRSKIGYGNAIVVDHGNGIKSLYAHLSKIKANKGDKVTVLDTIGNVGTTGRSTGPHLHIEVRKNGIPFNPFAVLPTLASSRL